MGFKSFFTKKDKSNYHKKRLNSNIDDFKPKDFIFRHIADFEEEISLLDEKKVINAAIEYIRSHFEVQRVSIAIYDESKDGFIVFASTMDDSIELGEGRFISSSDSYLKQAFVEKRPFYNPDLTKSESPTKIGLELRRSNLRTTFVIPMIYQDISVGCLNIGSNLIDAFSEELQQIFVILAKRLSLALQNALLHEKQKQTTTKLFIINEELKESEEKYRTLVENASDGILIIQDGITKYLNEASAELAQVNREDIIHTPFINYIHPDSLEFFKTRYEKRMAGENVPNIYETKIKTSKGTPLEVEINASVINYQGRPADLVTVRDITNRKKVERELLESEERFRTIITNNVVGVWVTDKEDITTFINPALEEMIGYSQEELIGKKVIEFLHPDSLEFFEDVRIQRYIQGVPSSIYELKWKRKDGSILVTRVAGAALFNQDRELVGSFGMLSDITREREALEALEKSEERYRTLVDLSPDAITMTDLKLNVIEVNQQALELFGAENSSEIIGMNALDLIAPEDRTKAMENALRAFSEGKPISEEYMLLRKDGSIYPAEMNAKLILNENNDPTAFISITRDITKRKKTERLLLESEELYRNLVERANDGITIVQDQVLKYVNPRLAQITGYSIEELEGSLFSKYLHPASKALVESYYKLRAAGEAIPQIYEAKVVRKDGNPVDIEINAGIIIHEHKPATLTIIRDITYRKMAEKALRQVKKEEERYHAMLSHFLNNDLQKIINNLDLISLEYEAHKKLNLTNVNTIIEIASRSSKTIDNVNKIFAILQTPFTKDDISVNLLSILEATIFRLTADLSYEIPIKLKREQISKDIYCDENIERVFYELLTFILGTRGKDVSLYSPIIVEGRQQSVYFSVVMRDDYSDTISDELSKSLSGKITDEWEYQGHFSGLALASVIMQHYGGQLKIRPIYNRGNEFQLLFPIELF